MSNENTIQQAEQLFDAEKYSEALSMCLAIIDGDDVPDKYKVYVIAAKATLFLIHSPKDNDVNKYYLPLVKQAIALEKTFEEHKYIDKEIQDSYENWEARTIKEQIGLVEENPTLEQLKAYINLKPLYSLIRIQIMLATGGVKKYVSENPEAEHYCYTAAKVLEEEDIDNLEFESAMRIFEKTKNRIDENADSSAEYLQNLLYGFNDNIYTAKSILEMLLRHSEKNDEKNNKKSIDNEKRCDWLKAHAEIIDYWLNLVLYPNGVQCSLIQGKDQRIGFINELKGIYAEIEKYDPLFEPPMLPNENGYTLPSAQKGGCYVATAVYGSYDCPQVWTLRRFRDDTLAETWYGRAFIHTYYAVSPTLVKWFGQTEWFKNMWKPTLDRMVKRLNSEGVMDTPYNDRAW